MNYYPTERAWFCLRSQPKHEHIASANLKRLADIEVFCPRLRSRILTRRGPVWMTESLFPNYLFVRFNYNTHLDLVKYTSGVSHIVQFANRYPVIPDIAVEELKNAFGDNEVRVAPEVPEAGDTVVIADNAFFGMEATVLRVLEAKERIQVLIEMLGRSTTIELHLRSIVPAGQYIPAAVLNARP